MVDFHSHILPMMDDGSRSVEMSLEMLDEEKKQKITDVILTPHFYPETETISNFLLRREKSASMLLKNIKGKELPRLYLGAEVAYYYGISSNKELDKLCIEGTRAILIEMPFSRWRDFEIEEILKISDGLGFQPILAHIERYLDIVTKKTLKRLYENNVMFQSNAEFFINPHTRKKALKLFSDNMIDFIGSDSHNMDTRSPKIGQALDIIFDSVGNDITDDFINFSYDLISIASEYI